MACPITQGGHCVARVGCWCNKRADDRQ